LEALSNLSVLLGSSWASGVNLYLTVAGLGIAGRFGWVNLPGNLETITSLPVILIALVLFAVEFFADKIPYVDSAWDSIHTFIRPVGGATLAYMAMAGVSPAIQMPVALLGGGIAMDSHLTKATARVAINSSPEPVTNSLASLSEDALVVSILWLIIKHPIIATILVILFILFSIWFLKKMFKFLKVVICSFKMRKTDTVQKV